MLNTITTIKSNLRLSSNVYVGMLRKRSSNLDEHKQQVALLEAFLTLNTGDRVISKAMTSVINANEETEIHNVIAALSYAIPTYGLNFNTSYEVDKAKVFLAAVIMTEYMKVYGTRNESVMHSTETGARYSIERHYVAALALEAVEKNLLEGIHFQPGKVLKKHISVKPGAPALRLDKRLKDVARGVSSMGLRIIQDYTEEDLIELMLDGDDYKSALKGEGSEHRLAMKERFSRYAKLAIQIQAQSVNAPIYLSVFFDYRGRMYYDVNMQLLNPQSKVGKYMYEASEARKLTAFDYRELCFGACSIVSRIKLEDSVAYYEANEAYIRAELGKEDDLLKGKYNKRLIEAIDDYRAGNESRFLLMLDYTTGGLIHFSSGYTQEYKSLKLANIIHGEELQDTHGSVANALENLTGIKMTRNDAKVINQSILAGASLKSAKKAFEDETGKEIGLSEFTDALVEVYGETALIFNQYNRWGKSLVDNNNSSLKWTAMDGVKCMSSAYIKGQQVVVYIPTTSNPANKKVTIYRNMPILMDMKSKSPLVVGPHAEAKVSGYLANTTHSEDATDIRAIIMAMAEAGKVGIFVHDNIAASGATHALQVRPTAKNQISNRFISKRFLQIQEECSRNIVGKYIPVIDYSVNDTAELVVSNSFLQS